MSKIRAKKLLTERIERERNYLNKQEVGTKEYNESMERLNILESKLAELEDKFAKNTIEMIKFGIGGVVIPVGMSLLVLKWEETGSVTTALKSWITNNVPKKMF